ncbi:MAG: AIR synthase-related protein, partial [Candidatus Njordarchaeota archaeon]
MMGIPMVNNKFVSNKNARPGDYIIMTKGAGIEGTWILSEALGEKLDLDDRIIQNIKKLKSKISVLPDVRAIVNVGVDNIHALHDATEGGLIGALFEIADASNVGFTVDESKIIVLEETRKIASKLAIDPLRLISSGTLIAVVDKDVAEEALSMLKKEDITAEIIGKITEDKKIIRRIDGRSEEIKKPSVDELWRVLSEIR